MLEAGAVGGVMGVVRGTGVRQLVDTGLWVLSNLCRGDPLPSYGQIREVLGLFGEVLCGWEFGEESVCNGCYYSLVFNYPRER